jgi:hypothetical protein
MKMFWYKNFVVNADVLVRNTLASTHLVANQLPLVRINFRWFGQLV